MKTRKTFILIGISALFAAVFLFAACSGAFIDPGYESGAYGMSDGDNDNGSYKGGSGSGGGTSLEGTYTKTVYTLEFTSTNYSLKTVEVPTDIIGTYGYDGTTLTLNMYGVDIKGNAEQSGSSLILNGFGAYFDGTWIKG
jgi:hypothetical protein